MGWVSLRVTRVPLRAMWRPSLPRNGVGGTHGVPQLSADAVRASTCRQIRKRTGGSGVRRPPSPAQHP